MKFVKGIVVGSAITAAAYIMYAEGMINKRKIMKQAKKMAYKMGIDF